MAQAQGTGWFSAPNEIFERDDLTVNERVVLLFLCRTVGPDGSAWPSYARIGKACGLSPRSAINAIQSLVDKRLVEATPRYDNEGRRTSNVYRLRFGNRQGATGAPPYARGAQLSEQGEQDKTQVSGYAPDAQAHAENAGGPMHVVHPPYAPGAQEGHPLKVTHKKDSLVRSDEPNGTTPSPQGGSGYPPEFEAFWSAYPPNRRLKKKLAFKRWQAAQKKGKDNPDPATADELERAAANYARHCRDQQTEARFIMHPTTFLSLQSRAWEDYLGPTSDARASPAGVPNAGAYQPVPNAAVAKWKELYPDEYDP